MSNKTSTELESRTGSPRALKHVYPKRPSWKSYGEGRAVVELRYKPGWDRVDIRAAEVPEGGRGTKEVYVSVPVAELRKLLQETP